MQISFYRLTQGSLEAAVQKLLLKIYDLGKRAVVVTDSPERTEALNTALWTLGHASFLPHGSARDGKADKQPIWLTHQVENPNQASVLVVLYQGFAHVLETAAQKAHSAFERCVIFFDGTAPEQTLEASLVWKKYSETEHALTFWSQENKGDWKQLGTFPIHP